MSMSGINPSQNKNKRLLTHCFSVNLIIQMLNYRYRKKKLYFDSFSSDKCAILGLCKLSSHPHTMPATHLRSVHSHKLKLENESSHILISHHLSLSHTRKQAHKKEPPPTHTHTHKDEHLINSRLFSIF